MSVCVWRRPYLFVASNSAPNLGGVRGLLLVGAFHLKTNIRTSVGAAAPLCTPIFLLQILRHQQQE